MAWAIMPTMGWRRPVPFSFSRSKAVASNPSMTGICTSINTRSIRNGLGVCHTRPRRGFVIGGGGGSSPTRENRLARPRQRYLLLKESGSMRKSVMLAMVVAVLGATPGVFAQDDRGPDGQAD